MIKITGLTHHIGTSKILDDISLTLPKGGVTALVGANGAGKSTLFSLIARLLPVQVGHITVDDLTIGHCANDILAQKLSILPQNNDITPRLTVQELVSFGRYPYHKGRPSADDREKVQNALQSFDLLAMAHRSLDSLSGGQRQRAFVAMTFAQDTDYVLLDEPLNNLDIAASRNLMQMIRRLAHDHDRSIVTVLHDINYASRYADLIVTMKHGRIIALGPPSDIVTTEVLRAVFDTDARVELVGDRPVVLV